MEASTPTNFLFSPWRNSSFLLLFLLLATTALSSFTSVLLVLLILLKEKWKKNGRLRAGVCESGVGRSSSGVDRRIVRAREGDVVMTMVACLA